MDALTRPLTILGLVALAACAAATRQGSADLAGVEASTAAADSGRSPPVDVRRQWLDMFARGYFPGRSGQVFVVPREGHVIVTRDPQYRFMHGTPWDYDARIPVLFHGPPFIRRGEWAGAVAQQDVAPTLAALIGATPPATFTGRALTHAIAADAGRPSLVVVVVIDAMRADYFEKYADLLPTLVRLRREGAWFSEARANSLPTVTAVGHATLGTGADPRVHGIAVNTLFNRVSGKAQPSYDGLDPRELMALTLADAWNLETDGRAVIIGHGGAMRATAGLVGRGGCLVNGRRILAASYNARDGGWETNPACYTLPEALKSYDGRRVWEAAGGRWMGHDISDPGRFRASSLYQRFEGQALLAVMSQAPIGADDVTDLVMVNMKGPDFTAHAHGPHSPEIRETLAELDRQMAALLATIERKAGRGRSVVVVTADHGMPDEPPAGGRHYTDEIVALIDRRFDPAGRAVVPYYDAANSQLYVDVARLEELGFYSKELAAFLESQPYLAAAFTEDEVRAAQAALPRTGNARRGP